MTKRETWLNGWARHGQDGDLVHWACAGCGKQLGTPSFGLTEEDMSRVWPPEPNWPFEEKTCPLCALRLERWSAGDSEKYQIALGALADIGSSSDMTISEIRRKATRVYHDLMGWLDGPKGKLP